MAQQAGFIKVQKALSGVSYPASKDDLVNHAKNNGAGKDIPGALQKMPDGEYDGPNKVSSAVAHE